MTLQYRTITNTRGRLRFDGRDAVSFLHALVTNDVAGLAAGRGVYAAWLTPQGRMIADLRILRLEDHLLVEVPEGMSAELQQRFDHLIFSEDVRVTDVIGSAPSVLVAGPDAARAVSEASGIALDQIEALPILGHVAHGAGLIVRTDDTAHPTFEMSSEAIFPKIASELIFEGWRIAAGRPKFGVDMTTETIPLEAGLLDRAISQSKGCYVGQEVIVRILHRGGGKVVRHLMRLEFESGVPVPEPGTPLTSGERNVGAVTSAAIHPETGRTIALGYVHRDAANPGGVLTTPVGRAEIVGFAG